MKADRMWTDIGSERAELLKTYGFDIVGWQFVKRAKSKPWILEFEHVRDHVVGNASRRAIYGPVGIALLGRDTF